MFLESNVIKTAFIFMAPFLFAFLYVLTAGLLSLPHQKYIVKGKFPRQLTDPVYRGRRLYGLCWTAVYYFTPIYFLFLTVPLLKRMLFRLFGYKGNLDFTVYPDTWIRDLPLLNFGKGAYISNRATIGTNIIMNNGRILVDNITVEEGAQIGHLTMLAPGVHVGKHAEIGVGCGIALKVKVQEGVTIGPMCSIDNGVVIRKNAVVKEATYIGTRSVIGEGIRIPPGANIPFRSVIKRQEEMSDYISSETKLHDSD